MKARVPLPIAVLAVFAFSLMNPSPAGAQTPGLVAAYAFDEGSGTTVADASGNNNNGTITAATWTTAGKFGNALAFNGTSARVTVPNAASLQLTTGMTLEAWVFPTGSLTSWRSVVDKTVDGYYLMASTDQSNRPGVGGTWTGGNQNVAAPTVLTINTWTHLAATFDGATVRLFVNGVQVASQAQTTPLATTPGTLQMGANSYGEFFAGRIDEVRIYNRALSATEIQTDMNTSIAPSAPDTTAPSAPTTLTATAASASQINLAWSASTDNVGVTGYRVERCQGAGCTTFAQVSAPTATSFNDTGLAAGTSYSYQVRATDAAGNLSAYSSVASATTQTPDTTAPTAPTGLSATAASSAQINLAWTASTDNVGVTGYRVERCQGAGCTTFAQIAAPTTTSFNNTGLTAGTSYSYQVRAADAAGNLSAYSSVASATTSGADNAGVFTHRNDNFRTGQNPNETVLAPANVTPATFGKLFACAVDGEVYAQPLYVANFAIAGGTHNVVFVATQNDSVFAFDADASPCVQYWQKSFLGTGVTTVPPGDTGETGDINTQIGITGTPVIDPATGTLYVVAKTKETAGTGCSDTSPCYFQRLHALDLATGNEKFNGPANISSAITVPGSGDRDSTCPAPPGSVAFCPLRESQRPGLLLLNGKVYVAWASHGDITPYHGWVIGYAAADLAQAPVVFNTTPDGGLGGIWMSGTGPAADADGNIYLITGNGTFDTAAPRTNYGDSFIRLSPASGLSVADFFTPANQSNLNDGDLDLGSGGAIVLPDSAGSPAHPHLLIGGDKQGVLYVIDRDNMTGFNPDGDQILQTVPITAGPACTICRIFSTPAFWEGKLYVVAVRDVLKQYTVANGVLSALPALQAGDTFGFPGATPAISSNGAANGIVWALDTSNNGTHGSVSGPAILFAYDATNLNKLYSSPASGAEAAGNAVKFTVPTVANGKVYVGTQTELSVFGLLPN